MEVMNVILSMERDLGTAITVGEHAHNWYRTLHPSIFATWSTALTTDPADVINAVLSQTCPDDLSIQWWRRYGFQLIEANDLFMLIDRDASLSWLLPIAMEGIIWRIARGYMVSYSPNDYVHMDSESVPQMAATRLCAKRMWTRLWQQPANAVKAPCLQEIIRLHQNTLSALWAEEPEEAYLAHLGAASFIERRHRDCFYQMLYDTFPQFAPALRWLDQEKTECDDAWDAMWKLAESSQKPGAVAPCLDDVGILIN